MLFIDRGKFICPFTTPGPQQFMTIGRGRVYDARVTKVYVPPIQPIEDDSNLSHPHS